MRNSSYRKHTSSTPFVVVKIGTLLDSSGEIVFSNSVTERQGNTVWFEEEHASNYMNCCSGVLGFFSIIELLNNNLKIT